MYTFETMVLTEGRAKWVFDGGKKRHDVFRMRLSVYALLLLIGVEIPATAAVAPENTRITVRVVDGRTGKPLKFQHLLFFGGPAVEAAKQHQQHYEIVTGRDGTAILSLAPETRWLQVWIDWHVLC